jgi:hypothetical protein
MTQKNIFYPICKYIQIRDIDDSLVSSACSLNYIGTTDGIAFYITTTIKHSNLYGNTSCNNTAYENGNTVMNRKYFDMSQTSRNPKLNGTHYTHYMIIIFDVTVT